MPQIAQQDYIRIFCPNGVDIPGDEQKKQLADCFDAGTIFDVILEDEYWQAKILSAIKDDEQYTFRIYSNEVYIVEYTRE